MSIETEVFKRTRIDFQKLKEYGFIKQDRVYRYSKEFMENFRADILVNEQGDVWGRVFDLTLDEEYTNFRMETQIGAFASSVREAYQTILKDIVKQCSKTLYFITDQANRITETIQKIYHDEPEFAWETSPGYGIFRNPVSKKWYGLIMNIDKSKIDDTCSGEVEIINVKLEEEQVQELLEKEGFYPSYHMNKKKWITIILDDTLTDEEIMEYVKKSHTYTEVSREWIIPANPNYFDIINYFHDTDTIIWKQSNHIGIGDFIYLYVAKPYSAILYKCEVMEVDIPYQYHDENLSMMRGMKLKLRKHFPTDEYTLAVLAKYGIKAIRGPRKMPDKLSRVINKHSSSC